MKTIYILWLRQLKRYWRSRARMIGSLGQPILYLLALGYGFGPIFQRAGGGSYIQFIAPGVIAMSIIFTSVFGGIELIWDKQFGFLKETMVAPVPRYHIMLGRTLGGATVATIQGVIVFLLTLIVGFRPHDWILAPLSILAMAFTAIIFTAFGTAIASKLEDMQAFPIIINFLIMPLFFLSGSIFPLNNLPHGVFVATKLNPLTYGVDSLRQALIGMGQFTLVHDFAMLALVSVLFLAVGSYMFSKIQA